VQRALRNGLILGATAVVFGAAGFCVRRGEHAPPRQRELPLEPREHAASPRPSAPASTPQATTSGAATPRAPLDTERSSEDALMREAERVLAQAPQQTLALIDAADRRFGSAVEARRKLEIEALVRLQRIGLAHSKADRFYRAFPDSPSIREIERRTGYHPRPTGPADD
jgi:hypothetical protein